MLYRRLREYLVLGICLIGMRQCGIISPRRTGQQTGGPLGRGPAVETGADMKPPHHASIQHDLVGRPYMVSSTCLNNCVHA